MQNLQLPFAKYLSVRMPLVFITENCDTKSSSPLSVEYYMHIPMQEQEDGVRCCRITFPYLLRFSLLSSKMHRTGSAVSGEFFSAICVPSLSLTTFLKC